MWLQQQLIAEIQMSAGFDWTKTAAPMLPKDANGNFPSGARPHFASRVR